MSLNSLLLHVLLITPVCQYLLSSPRFPKPRNFIFAAAFLAAVALAGEVSEWSSRAPNFYRVLDVDRNCSAGELKAAFRALSLKFHPDKNKAPEAVQIFQSAQEAYETLNDAESRRLYERYGPAATKDARARAQLSGRGDGEVLLGLAGFYALWSALTYLLTLGKARAQGRTWSFVGLLLCAFTEFQISLGGMDLTKNAGVGLLSRTTPFEQVAVLHAFYPAFMHACILLSQFTFVDLDQMQMQLLHAVLASNEHLIKQLNHVILCVDKKGGAAAVSGRSEEAAEQGAGNRGEEGLTLAQRMARAQAAQQRLSEAQQQKQGKGGMPSWLPMVGIYILFNYILK